MLVWKADIVVSEMVDPTNPEIGGYKEIGVPFKYLLVIIFLLILLYILYQTGTNFFGIE